MLPRNAVPMSVAAAAFAAALGYAAPAAAAVRYDPGAQSGSVGAGDVRKAFGWTAATLDARASQLEFSHDFWTTDRYSVSCGKGSFVVRHEREFGRYELAGVAVREPRRGSSTAYGEEPRLVAFRIDGPRAGVSGTSVPPAVGQPCPQPRGARITRADLVSTATGWSLTVSSGTASRILRTGR